MSLKYVEGIPGELDKYFKKNKRNLVILEDLMDEASKSLEVTQQFPRGRRKNHSVTYLTQNFFDKNQRTLSLNSN